MVGRVSFVLSQIRLPLSSRMHEFLGKLTCTRCAALRYYVLQLTLHPVSLVWLLSITTIDLAIIYNIIIHYVHVLAQCICAAAILTRIRRQTWFRRTFVMLFHRLFEQFLLIADRRFRTINLGRSVRQGCL